ncbi:zinc finger protein [Macleaya cordata]|uniref:Zinc finger protein n=1 Tax=Macleaya cordata TaxID=56857 RepID=A0A200PMD4_MACCD|nr:zinc finger protein [Macleaya cordata]
MAGNPDPQGLPDHIDLNVTHEFVLPLNDKPENPNPEATLEFDLNQQLQPIEGQPILGPHEQPQPNEAQPILGPHEQPQPNEAQPILGPHEQPQPNEAQPILGPHEQPQQNEAQLLGPHDQPQPIRVLPFPCHYCPRRFGRGGALGGHERIHRTDELPRMFPSKLCLERFETGQKLGGHVTRVHVHGRVLNQVRCKSTSAHAFFKGIKLDVVMDRWRLHFPTPFNALLLASGPFRVY